MHKSADSTNRPVSKVQLRHFALFPDEAAARYPWSYRYIDDVLELAQKQQRPRKHQLISTGGKKHGQTRKHRFDITTRFEKLVTTKKNEDISPSWVQVKRLKH